MCGRRNWCNDTSRDLREIPIKEEIGKKGKETKDSRIGYFMIGVKENFIQSPDMKMNVL